MTTVILFVLERVNITNSFSSVIVTKTMLLINMFAMFADACVFGALPSHYSL